jgi:hypothetical protein
MPCNVMLCIIIRRVYTFDKSPDYMRDQTKLDQIQGLLPKAKLIMILRNPSARAYSGTYLNVSSYVCMYVLYVYVCMCYMWMCGCVYVQIRERWIRIHHFLSRVVSSVFVCLCVCLSLYPRVMMCRISSQLSSRSIRSCDKSHHRRGRERSRGSCPSHR